MPKIDEHIRQAQQEGKFENLPGKGQPLHLDENPLEDPDWRLASHILRSSGFTLPWIEARREIEEEVEEARAALTRAWNWRNAGLAENQPFDQVEAEWKRALHTFVSQIGNLNRRIRDYNLQAPSERFHLRRLSLEAEMRSLVDRKVAL